VRADSGFYGDHFLSFLEERASPYIVVAQLTSYLKSRLYQVSQWQAIDQVYCVTELHFKLCNWKTERRFVVVREEVQTNKAAVGRNPCRCTIYQPLAHIPGGLTDGVLAAAGGSTGGK
jgi:hypothetical protein